MFPGRHTLKLNTILFYFLGNMKKDIEKSTERMPDSNIVEIIPNIVKINVRIYK